MRCKGSPIVVQGLPRQLNEACAQDMTSAEKRLLTQIKAKVRRLADLS